MISRLLVVLCLVCFSGPNPGRAAPEALAAATLTLPLEAGSVRFAVMGDTGRGSREQYEVAKQMVAFHEKFPFDLVIMLGDNIYGSDTPEDMANKFSTPYEPLLAAGVEFRASLGNHDNPNQRFYKLFNMGGERYYSFRGPKETEGNGLGSVRFFAIDSNYLDKEQLAWLDAQLAAADARVEDRLLPSPPLLVRLDSRLRARVEGSPGAPLREVRRERRVLRSRPRLRAHQAPEGRHRVLGVRCRWLACARETSVPRS